MGGTRPLPAFDRPLRHRSLRGADRGRYPARRRARAYGSDDSRLPMSGMAAYTPGMEITGGSLGQGLASQSACAWASSAKGSRSFVYNLLSDGELDEGSTWEAAMSAGEPPARQPDRHRRRQQHAGGRPVDAGAELRAACAKFEAFGWHAQRVDGNNIPALVAALRRAPSTGGAAASYHLRYEDGQRRRVSRATRAKSLSCVSTPMSGRGHFTVLDAGRSA